ncbi:MAG: YceD family protein [Xanthomonadales bacterium]|nr:YceD family protein [Xanthomonadales bacterium]
MSLEFPDQINPWKAADSRRQFSGTIGLKRFERLLPMLSGTEGSVEFDARFGRDALGLVVLDLEIRGELPVDCQASLERYIETVCRRTQLVIAREGESENDFPSHYEVCVAEGGRLLLADVIEDELILTVPQVPRKPGLKAVRFTTDPEADVTAERESKEQNRPFAELDAMMRSGGSDTET